MEGLVSARLERIVEIVLTAGLLMSAALLGLGLLSGSEPLLRAGAMLLILTPAARVVVLTLGLALARDWPFAAVSLWILSVLLASLGVALRR
jgi:uncharacterized membrane protein